jgi:phosphatidylglycerol---prolipoprotein diacylglyceryl transferase
MIPFFEQPTLRLGPVTIYAFGVLVAAAMLAGAHLAVRRCRREGLDASIALDLVFYALVAGLLAAHLVAVLAYFPGEVARNPLMLLKIWENISSFGGIFGALFGIWLFLRLKAPGMPARTKWKYLDAIAFAFPFGWAIGRLGCTLAHDHPGAITRFPLGVSLATPEAQAYIRYYYEAAGRAAELPAASRLSEMAFHNLGWYEFLYTLLVIIPAFLLADRKPRPAGYYPALFALLYIPARFGMDFLRVSDALYLGLTPGQYMAAAAFAALLAAWRMGFPGRSR